MKTIYIDNNATTKVDPEVVEAMLPYLRDHWGNPSSSHSYGSVLTKPLEEAHEAAATLVHARRPSEIVFTSGGTESNNMAILGTLAAFPERRHIITTSVEHPSVRDVVHDLAKKGYEIDELKVNKNGLIDLEELKGKIRPATALVSIMWANNETGVLSPIQEIAEICTNASVPFHTDAVQAVGKIGIDIQKCPVDLLSASSHKLHGPKGIGFLYIKGGTKLKPLILGGGQERDRRPGTENVPGIIGLGKACELAFKNLEEENTHVKKMRDRLEAGILERISGTRINGRESSRTSNTANFVFENVEGESVLLLLDEASIAASSGSACKRGSREPSHVLTAMGIHPTLAQSALRLSLSKYNTGEEIATILRTLPLIIDRLRSWTAGGK